jgi:hypothetical protein
MTDPDPDRALSRARLVTAWVGREVGRFAIAQATKYFHRDTSTLARGVVRVEASMATSERFRASVSRIAKQMRRPA